MVPSQGSLCVEAIYIQEVHRDTAKPPWADLSETLSLDSPKSRRAFKANFERATRPFFLQAMVMEPCQTCPAYAGTGSHVITLRATGAQQPWKNSLQFQCVCFCTLSFFVPLYSKAQHATVWKYFAATRLIAHFSP